MLESGYQIKKVLTQGDVPQKREQGTCTDVYGTHRRVEVVKDQVVIAQMVRAVQTIMKEVREDGTQCDKVASHENGAQTDQELRQQVQDASIQLSVLDVKQTLRVSSQHLESVVMDDEDGGSNPLDEIEQMMDDVEKHVGSLQSLTEPQILDELEAPHRNREEPPQI